MDLELSEFVKDGYAVVELHGELDLSTVPKLRDRLLEILAAEAARLILDLSGLEFMDSTGLSVLVAAERRASQLGGTVSLVGPQKIVARVLHATSMDKHFPIFPTVADAILADGDGPPVAST